MRLLVQPGDGVKPLVEAIDSAKDRIEIAIFRFDRTEVEVALSRAVERGVFVHALIAYTNRGGERNLRQLEMRLLEKGVTVARTAGDLVRYHGKYMIVDRKELYLLAFNFTYLDMEHSRSFGVITHEEKLVEEARKLFEADSTRQTYEPGHDKFLVSPLNARKELSSFIEGAHKQLIVYDPHLGDPRILRLLEDRLSARVDVRVIGQVARNTKLPHHELGPMRLHTRSMIRDGVDVFLGSQSLRASELETRREVGILFTHEKIAARILETFEDDWKQSGDGVPHHRTKPPAVKAARKVAKLLTKQLPEVTPVVELIVREVVGAKVDMAVDAGKLEETVREAVKAAVEESVRGVVEEAVENSRVPG